MNITYEELIEAIIETYKELHKHFGDSIESTFYAKLENYRHHETYNKAMKLCIYMSYILILIEEKESFEFLKEDYKALVNNGDLEEYREELGVEFTKLCEDVEYINQHM